MSRSVQCAVEAITPQQAAMYLKKNANNRKLSPRRIASYARAITSGEWQINGETIKFAENGELLDGQHRLKAIVQADTVVETCVVRGLDSTAFKTIDGGKARSAGDCLYVLKYRHPNALAAATRMLCAYESGWGSAARSFRTISNDELIAKLETHRDLVTAAHEYMRRPNFTKLVPHSIGMFCFYMASNVDAERARRFFLELSSGRYSRHVQTHPPRVLRERLVTTSREVIKPTSNTKLAWMVLAWNAFVGHGSCPRLSRIIDTLPRFKPSPELKAGSK